MSDFYYIDIDDDLEKFNWVEVLPAANNLPGPRAKHGLVGTKEKLYLVGGLHSDIDGSNDIYSFHPDDKKWEEVKP